MVTYAVTRKERNRKMKATIQVTEQNFDSEVIQSTQPVIVDFYADWCGPCKMIAPALEEIATELTGKVKIAKVNVDEESALAQRYNIQSLPTLLYFQNGQVVSQTIGATSKKNILSKLNIAAAVA
ncbi:MAG TPA: thioredoxin [Candidatus Kapabacteria bacterium]|nr:thioredoxin [Candidatus Kapabacteria bacterium]